MTSPYPQVFPPPWADAWGDDRYGLWAELIVKGVTQRLRWIEPGKFEMGSPGTEPGHLEDEGPQHWVTLTEGLWLADTACTQALWQAVMGDNPSYAPDDPAKPVEQVNWNDAQRFCAALQTQGLIPAAIEAVLPTEAQWEYACRAGGTRAYSFGDTISPAQVNFDHDGSWEKRLNARQTTVAVKALPANAWGLYQMHGNVWEWCADDLRPYTEEAVSDPSGARGEDVATRALRGGSWDDFARDARSARRLQWLRVSGNRSAGFRFALRSTSQAGAGGRQAALSRAEPGGGGSGTEPVGRRGIAPIDDAYRKCAESFVQTGRGLSAKAAV